MISVGIDENGLGPRLGPLIVTSVVAKTTPTALVRLRNAAKGELSKRLGDSKALISFGDCGLGEAWARAIAERTSGLPCESPAEIVANLALDGSADLHAPCPADHATQCWGFPPRFTADKDLIEQARRDLTWLEERDIDIRSTTCVIVCVGRINEASRGGITRNAIDLSAMERLVLNARACHLEDVEVVCGKVGGMNAYPQYFRHLSRYQHTVVCEGAAKSTYEIESIGRVSWVRDAEAAHPLVALASLVGKCVREWTMGNIVRFYQSHEPSIMPASGYHDPVTSAFVEATAKIRKTLSIVPSCFERTCLATRRGRNQETEGSVTSSSSQEPLKPTL